MKTKIILATLLMLALSMTAQPKKEFFPVDWDFVKKEATENPERIKELVERFSAKKKGKPLTDEEKILAFYGQSYLTNDREDELYMFEMYELRKAGKKEECLALTRKMLEINPLNLDALTTASNILFSLAKDSTSLNEASDYLFRSRCIFWTILMTGDGSAEHPFDVTKISDEYNFMRHYLNIWKIKMQEFDGKCDIITLDGSSMRYNRPTIYFDVTRVREIISSQSKNRTSKKENLNSISTPTKDSVLIVINGEQCCDITSDFIINGTYDDYEKFLNSRNLTLERIDIWKNEKKKDQFRQKFGNWVKSVIEITARPTDRPTENPRGIYKLMSIKGGIQEINPYPHDVYKICTDQVTMRMTMIGGPNNMFRIDHSDPIVLNYTGEKTDLDRTADKSIRIFDSNDKHFTLKWWSTLPNSAYYPYNNWAYERYESGKYSKAAKPVAEMLTSAPAHNPNNPLIGTWQYVMKIDKMDGESQGNWIDELKKVDNLKDVLTYLRQSDPGEPKQFQVYTPSHFFIMRMLDNMKEMMGAFDNITYNGKESVTAPGGEVMEIHWLTDDFFAIKQRMGKKVLYRIWERVKDDQTMLNRIGSHFIQHKE